MLAQDPATLERRADRCAEVGDFAAALALRELAFAGWRARGDLARAAYLAAYCIAFDHLALFGSRAVAQGWLERGASLVLAAGECPEAGWVALSRALHTADPAQRAAAISRAAGIADRFGDADLGFDALAHGGLALVESGRVTEGMRRLDEAAAAARSGEVHDPVVAGEIFCKLLVACEGTLDVRRAQEWQLVTAPLGDRPALAWASAICRTHYGGILVAAGRWEEADHELSESVRLYDATYPALRSAALVRLAELRSRQGRLAESRQLLAGEPVDGDALRPWARTEWLCARDDDERAVVAARLAREVGQRRARSARRAPAGPADRAAGRVRRPACGSRHRTDPGRAHGDRSGRRPGGLRPDELGSRARRSRRGPVGRRSAPSGSWRARSPRSPPRTCPWRRLRHGCGSPSACPPTARRWPGPRRGPPRSSSPGSAPSRSETVRPRCSGRWAVLAAPASAASAH